MLGAIDMKTHVIRSHASSARRLRYRTCVPALHLRRLQKYRTISASLRGCPRGSVRRLSIRLNATMEDQPVHTEIVNDRTEIVLYTFLDWSCPILHYSLNGEPWRDAAFSQVQKSDWKMLRLDTKDTTPHVECVITDGNGCWDKPLTGGNYKITKTGMYTIGKGRMEVLKQSAPVLVVSDLDGTMVGDDAITKDFKIFWNRHSALTASVLVYNTGRSLESFLKLLEDKKDCLQVPSMLISAVGTKIYTHQSGSWEEDEQWVHQLNEDWNLDIVRSAAAANLASVGDDNMHFRPEEEQNVHKITCGVRETVVDSVVRNLEETLKQEEVQANVIVSGIGDWRFLDVVPKNAGKLEALNYVRERYGFAESSTVACGDSGNDILMLSGLSDYYFPRQNGCLGSNLAIVVGNAQPDLLDWVKGQQTTQEDRDRLYLAQQYEASGILEGLKKFGFT